MDAAVFTAVNSAHTPALDALMLGVTALGYFPTAWFVFGAAALWWPRARTAAFRLCLAVALAHVMASGVLKPLVARARPVPARMIARTLEAHPAVTYSFPSGHAATAVAGALGVSRILPQARWGFWIVAALIAYSRVYLGVHHPSDVAGGALLGLACAWLVLGARHPSTWIRPRAPAGVRHVA